MKRYYSADIHFGHANIARYCNRPTLRKTDLNDIGEFISSEIAIDAAERMDKFLIKSFNSRIKSDDIVIHVGDFMNKGKVRGIEGLRNKHGYYIEQLSGTWSFLQGNHDANNGIRSIGSSIFTDIGPYKVFVSHYPIENGHIFRKQFINYILKYTDFQICGHVHSAWKYKFHVHGNGEYLMYNVGVDAHKYIPLSDSEIIGDVTRILNIKKKDA